MHLIRDAIRRGDERIARVLMPQFLIRAEANLLRTVPDTRMRDAESVRQEILSDLALMFTQDGSEGHEDELDYYECKFLRALRFLRIDHVRAGLSRRKVVTDLPEAGNDQGEPTLDDEMLARLSRMASIGPSQEDSVYLPQVIKALDGCRRIRSAPSFCAASSVTRRKRPQRLCERERAHHPLPPEARRQAAQDFEGGPMITTTQTPLRDAMYAMSLAKPVPDAELLDEFVAALSAACRCAHRVRHRTCDRLVDAPERSRRIFPPTRTRSALWCRAS